MSLHLSFVALCLAGCASQFLAVPDSDWQTVPPPVRATVDKQNDAELASARAELAAASNSNTALQRSQPAPLPPAPPVSARKPDPDSDPWDVAIYEHEQARIAAFTRVENARADWLRTDRAWRERWHAAAQARIEMVTCKRELVRAQTIDRNLLGSDRYDTAPLRGQFSRAQQRWHVLATSAREARSAHERASATLASSKEAYAQLMRSGPGQYAAERFATDDRAARLELTSWTVTRFDIKRRRGLRNYLDTVARTPPTLRKRPLKLRAPAIVLPVEAAAAQPPDPVATAPAPTTPDKPAAPPTLAAPPVEKPAPQTTPGAKPWDVVEPSAPPAVARPTGVRKAAPGALVAPAAPGTPTAGNREIAPTGKPAAAPGGAAPPATTGDTERPPKPAAARNAAASKSAKPATPARAPAAAPTSAAKPVDPAPPPAESRTP
jgi:hypothetical protein